MIARTLSQCGQERLLSRKMADACSSFLTKSVETETGRKDLQRMMAVEKHGVGSHPQA